MHKSAITAGDCAELSISGQENRSFVLARRDQAKAVVGRKTREPRHDIEGLGDQCGRQIEDLKACIKNRPLLWCEANQLRPSYGQRNDEAVGKLDQQVQQFRLPQVDKARRIVDDYGRGSALLHWTSGPRISSSIRSSGSLRNFAARTGEMRSSANAR